MVCGKLMLRRLSYIQGDIYFSESYKVGSEIECRGLKSPAITRGA